MHPITALLAAAIGYLLGAISFARLMLKLLAPQADIAKIQHAVPDTAEVFESESVSATAIRLQFGARYGCLTAILDMLKTSVPVLIFKFSLPDENYYLIVAVMATVGHNYPVFYRFKGGRGLATVYGGFFALDWLGTLVTSLIGMGLGVLLGMVVLIRWAGLLLMIPWVWLRTQELAPVAYVVIANALFWYAMRRELRQYIRLKNEGKLPDPQQVAEFMGMGSMYSFTQRFSLANLVARLKRNVTNQQ